MFSLGKGLYKEMVKKDEYFVAVLGLDNAGKTTFVEQFKANFDKSYTRRHPSKITSTVGLNLVKVDCGRVILNLWDLGGEAGLRSLWKTYLEECHIIIYVVDASDVQRLDEAIESLEQILVSARAPTLPLLILLNKCDTLETHVNGPSTSSMPTIYEEPPLTMTNGHRHNDVSNTDCSQTVRDQIYQCVSQMHHSDLAVITISAIQNLNVQKCASWLIDALLAKQEPP
ncbi:ADP-ribosylation factor family domain-containing protein [Ditylenchus destructor]|nr:ADP-ribosylation factor family domain-containing protein [Ditylenchus destructor]